MQVRKKSESKLLERTYFELVIEGKAGKISRAEAIAAAATELGVPAELIGLVGLEPHSGTTDVICRLHVYSSSDARGRTHPRYLGVRAMSKEEREKLKQERKKAAAPAAPAAEAK